MVSFRKFFHALMAVCSFSAVLAQNQIYLNDVFYDRMFRSIIVTPTGTRDTTIKNHNVRKLNLYQLTKLGFESIPSYRGYPAFGMVFSSPIFNRINIDAGLMGYKRPFEDIPNTDNFAWVGSAGLSFYSKYAKIFAGGMFRWGNAPIATFVNDTLVWQENIRGEVNPYFYYELPIKSFSLATNIMPSFDYRTLAKLGLYAALKFGGIKNMAYVDRMQTPVGFDYDAGYEFKLGLLKSKTKSKNDILSDESVYAKVRLGNAFRVNNFKGETLEQKLNQSSNQYALFEICYLWVGGICYHQTNGLGWRIGVDYGSSRVRVTATYQRKYVLPIAFANQIDRGNVYISIKGSF